MILGILLCIKEFGEEYRDYKKEVPMLIPKDIKSRANGMKALIIRSVDEPKELQN